MLLFIVQMFGGGIHPKRLFLGQLLPVISQSWKLKHVNKNGLYLILNKTTSSGFLMLTTGLELSFGRMWECFSIRDAEGLRTGNVSET